MHGLNQYRGYQVETASPGDQVALLYDGARRFVDQAENALSSRNYEAVNHYTKKAQRILEELSATLNHQAGEIAGNLERLYEYWGWRLTQGLIRQDPEAFSEVSAALMEMHGAWMEAVRQSRPQRREKTIG